MDSRAAPDRNDSLALGRDAYGRRAWDEAYRLLARADAAAPLGTDDLEALAFAAFLSGRDREGLAVLERMQRAYLERGERPAAARCAFWLGFRLADVGEMGRASGWFARAHRLIEEAPGESVERGYLLLPAVQRGLASGDNDASFAAAEEAAAIAARFHDDDLLAFALHGQGRSRLRQGRLEDGLALLDEVMVAVTSDELSPVVTGIIYCSVIGACHEVRDVRRAHEWTAALADWCDRQPELVAFSGQCRVHRSQVMQFGGEWRAALEEARLARERAERGEPKRVIAAAWYQQAELHRLLGELADAEHAYQEAAQLGVEPHPGLALVWWAKGDPDAALASLRRLVRESTAPLKRMRALPPYVEVLVAAGDAGEAKLALGDLEALATAYPSEVAGATVAELRGTVAMAEGDAPAALADLREAWHAWQGLGAPYESARVRLGIAVACRAAGDPATAELELDAARAAFARLGASEELARLGAGGGPRLGGRLGLTPRELQVLRLLAEGSTNRTIADALSVSRRTVDRHVSNIFDKLGVNSRAAATALAYEHHLL